jgi:hypothetical protein
MAALPSWNDSEARSEIIEVVERATQPNSPDFIPPAERVATFDNDGTLWCEQPMQVQVYFLIDRVTELATREPGLKHTQPFRAVLDRDYKTLVSLGKQAIMELFFATHTGMTTDDFDVIARRWLATAVHPELGRRFTECTYRPQLELLDYLRDHGFKTYIVTAGGGDFIRAYCEQAYGISRDQVIGSAGKLRFEAMPAGTVLKKLPDLGTFDDREAKAENIGLHVGRRPIFAAGNSDGDLAMMRYALSSKRLHIATLVHHDDAMREFAYDRDFKLSPLREALDEADRYGITVISMKRDWNRIF